MSGKESKCAKEEEDENSMENRGTECLEEKKEKQYLGSNVLGNSQKEKLLGEHLGETAKFEQVKQETVRDCAGEKDEQNANRNVSTEKKKPVNYWEKIWTLRRDLPYINMKDVEHILAEQNVKSSFQSNFNPLKRTSEDKEDEEEEREDEEDEEEEEDDSDNDSSYKLEYSDPFVIYVAAPSTDIPPPAPPPSPPLPPPPPDLLDDFNPDIQQQHINFNPPVIENNVFHPEIIEQLPPHHSNPAPSPPDYLE